MDETPRMDPNAAGTRGTTGTKGTTGTTGTTGIRKKSGRGVLLGLLAVVIAFFIGFFWQWYEASTVREALARTEQELRVERLRVQLGQAAMAAQSGDFESARTQMSDFFTRLQNQQDELPPALAGQADEFLDQRDDIITGLSRSNPQYAGVLYRMLGQFTAATPGGFEPARTSTPSQSEGESGAAGAAGAADSPGTVDTAPGAEAPPGG